MEISEIIVRTIEENVYRAGTPWSPIFLSAEPTRLGGYTFV